MREVAVLAENSSSAVLKDYYDYIITGAGCAGLSLAVHMINSGKFAEKKILIIDKAEELAGDKTWCFWEKERGDFEDIVYSQWQKLRLCDNNQVLDLDIRPYTYKMIRSVDYYQYCRALIYSQANFTLLYENVEHIFSSEQTTGIMIHGKAIHCSYIFNSILFNRPILTGKQFWMLQHFKGWMIETEDPSFDSSMATLMDFRTGQQQGTTFYYVLPITATKALIEYTVFSTDLLENDQYVEKLRCYISNDLKIIRYKIISEEFGVIPMTNFRFTEIQNNIINIGTAGGQTKSSSGYTFSFIQKHSKLLVKELIEKNRIVPTSPGRKYSFYDSVLLNVLYNKTYPGEKIFIDLFKKNPPQKVLGFLDNESSALEDLAIISTLPFAPFLKAAMQQIFT